MIMFGQRIRDLRRTRRLTQRDLADRLQALGLRADFTYLSKIENGHAENPPSEELIRGLARVLETDPEELLDLAGKFSPKALQEVAAQIPEAGLLLRRLQTRQLSKEQIRRIRQILQEASESNERPASD
jgi:HTH-type transcriptional regulator, competence development regulator